MIIDHGWHLPDLYAPRASCMQTDRQRGEQHQRQDRLQSIGCVSDREKKIQKIRCFERTSSSFLCPSTQDFSSSGLLDCCWSTMGEKKCYLPIYIETQSKSWKTYLAIADRIDLDDAAAVAAAADRGKVVVAYYSLTLHRN